METSEILALIQDVAEQVVRPRFRALAEGQVLEKNPGDLVTVADREAEVLLTQALHAAYPEAVVLGEEAYAAQPETLARFLAAEHAFTVDPVDGTRNFVHGSPDHAVMVAETRGGESVRAWVWQPEHGVAWVAERGAGCERNGAVVRRAPVADPLAAQGVTSRWAARGESLGGLPPLERSWASCGIDYPRLIEGACDFVVYTRAHAWDHAPGSLLLTEAGGYAGVRGGGRYTPGVPARSGLLVAADEGTFDAVVDRI